MKIRDWTPLLRLSRRLTKLTTIAFNFVLKTHVQIHYPKHKLSPSGRISIRLAAAASCVLVCSGISHAQAAQAAKPQESPAQYLYGTWYSYPPGNPETDPIRHEFRHNRTTDKDEIVVMRLCPGDYRAAIAKATSPVEITSSTIRVLKHAASSEKGEMGSECKSNIEPGLWSYTISDEHDRLTITNPGGTPDLIELARQDTGVAQLPSTLYGTWLFPSKNEGDVSKEVRLLFYNDAESVEGKVREIAICRKGNSALTSQVDAKIRVSADVITILNSTSHTEKKGPFTCEVTITSGAIHYSVSPSGSNLKLRSETGASMMLTRDSGAGLN
jgi:hypothetical protein